MSEVTTDSMQFPVDSAIPVDSTKDVLTKVLRQGAQRLLSQAIAAEVVA